MYKNLHLDKFLNTQNIFFFSDSKKDTYAAVGNPFKFIQLLQFLEVLHPLFGYTKTNLLMSFLQIGSRAFVLFCMIDAEPRMQTKHVVFYLFLLWNVIELVKYPYYITEILNIKISFLTWLRYTMWIPLYPLGFLCEAIVILRNIPYFEETQKFTVSLPNAYNFTFHSPSFLRIYLLIFFVPGLYTFMSYMKRLRNEELGNSNIKRAHARTHCD